MNCEKWIVCNCQGCFLLILRNYELSTFHFVVAVHVLPNNDKSKLQNLKFKNVAWSCAVERPIIPWVMAKSLRHRIHQQKEDVINNNNTFELVEEDRCSRIAYSQIFITMLVALFIIYCPFLSEQGSRTMEMMHKRFTICVARYKLTTSIDSLATSILFFPFPLDWSQRQPAWFKSKKDSWADQQKERLPERPECPDWLKGPNR